MIKVQRRTVSLHFHYLKPTFTNSLLSTFDYLFKSSAGADDIHSDSFIAELFTIGQCQAVKNPFTQVINLLNLLEKSKEKKQSAPSHLYKQYIQFKALKQALHSHSFLLRTWGPLFIYCCHVEFLFLGSL